MAAAAPDPATDTIFALSSGRPPAAIAVMRISGSRSRAIAASLAGTVPEPRHATLTVLRDAAGAWLDHALLLFFPAPASATGEDVVELHLHGSVAVVAAVSDALVSLGLRLAEPGEFTRRALLNGKLDLAGVEGLADLLAAETETQRRDALLRGSATVPRLIADWAARLTELAAIVEAAIDYDGDDEVATEHDVRPAAAAIAQEMTDRLGRLSAERLRDGIRVAIVGPVNAGKSTLFNAIVSADAAIVSATAGTTRDVIERPVAIGGIPFVLADTAGDRATDDPLEQAGIERARTMALGAELVIDLGSERPSDECRIAVSARCDEHPVRPNTLPVSVHAGLGVAELLQDLITRARHLLPLEGEAAFEARHREAVGRAAAALAALAGEDDPLIQAEQLAAARAALGSMTGDAGLETMLDALFGRFCLGK